MIKARRLRFASYCLRTADQAMHLVFWIPTGGCSSRGRQRITYPDTSKNDIELEEQEIIKLMKDIGNFGLNMLLQLLLLRLRTTDDDDDDDDINSHNYFSSYLQFQIYLLCKTNE